MIQYKKNQLCLFGHQIKSLIGKYQKPTYIYFKKEIERRYNLYQKAFASEVEIHFATKSNNHPQVLKLLKKLGAGVDVVSAGEMKDALEAGFKPNQILFSGVGKTESEIRLALKNPIKQLNVECPQELERIGKIAKSMKKTAHVALRMNPDVNPNTHPYITTGFRENKFGMDHSFLPEVQRVLKKYEKSLKLQGLTLHIGSQILETGVFVEAIQKTLSVYKSFQAQGHNLSTFDIGGGVGISYREGQTEPDVLDFGKAVKSALKELGCKILAEPGRFIVGPAGVLVSEVQYIKKTPFKNFAIVDTGMHHLLRPALYDAYHRILPLLQKPGSELYDIVGPICESSDVIGRARAMSPLEQGDFIAILDSGAYGRTMASAYNSHSFPKEILV
jgi:diaminopimelate decarboxylase